MKNIQKIAILSVSVLTIMSSAAMIPALPYINDYFSNASELSVKMVISLPSFFIIPVTLLTGRLIFYVKKKHILYIALSLYLIGGLGGALQNSIIMLLIFRSMMGIGVGLLIPLTKGLIADFFSGKERSKMMGYSTAANNFGGIIAVVFAGLLTALGWRFPFLVYSLAIIVLFLVIFFLPNQEIPAKNSHSVHINKNVWIIGLSHFMLILIFFSVPTGLGYYIEVKDYGTGLTTGFMISLVTLGSFLIAIAFHRVSEFFKHNTIYIGLLLITCGMFGIGLAEQLFTVAVSLALVGFGLGILSTMVYLFTSLESSKNDVTLSLAIVSCFSFLGQFTSPIINQFIQDIFGTHSVESTFFISGYIGILAIIIVIVNQYIKIYTPKRQPD